MRILAVVQGEYGRRIFRNIGEVGPAHWQVEVFEAPRRLPPVIDFPDRFLPAEMPPADLLLSLGEMPGAADLITAIVRRTGAGAVIAPIDTRHGFRRGWLISSSGSSQQSASPPCFPSRFVRLPDSVAAIGGLQNPTTILSSPSSPATWASQSSAFPSIQPGGPWRG